LGLLSLGQVSFAQICPDHELLEICEQYCLNDQIDCFVACGSDTNCVADCNRAHARCSSDCPCNENCPNGCYGCSNPLCQDSTTSTTISTTTQPFENKSVLILSTYYGEKKPLLVDFEGNTNESFQFRFGTNTEVYGSCPVVFQGENFIFGGATNKRQVSKISDCWLNRQSDLPFDFNFGSCGTYNNRVHLCFTLTEKDKCWEFDGVDVTDGVNSVYSHVYAKLSTYKGNPFVVGHSSNTLGNTAESFSLETRSWQVEADYPFSKRLADYAAVSFGNSVFIYGGNDGKAEMRTVAEYRNGTWNKVGDMLYKREGHNAILNGNIALIMGGFGSFKTERWTHDHGDLSAVEMTPVLSAYSFYPALFLVENDYCSKN